MRTRECAGASASASQRQLVYSCAEWSKCPLQDRSRREQRAPRRGARGEAPGACELFELCGRVTASCDGSTSSAR